MSDKELGTPTPAPLPPVDRDKIVRTAAIHGISEEKAEQLIRATHSQDELDSAASASGRWE